MRSFTVAVTDVRVVVVYVDGVDRGLLQSKEMNRLTLQYVCGGCEKLVKAPALLLVCLQDTC